MGGSPCWNWCLTKFAATKSPVPTTVAAHRFLPLHGRLRQLASPPSHRILQTFQCTAHLNQNFDGCWRNATEKKLERPKSVLICYDIFRFLLLFFQFKSSKFEFASQNTQKHKQYLLTSPKKIPKKHWETFHPILSPPKRYSAGVLDLKEVWTSFLKHSTKHGFYPLQATWMSLSFPRWQTNTTKSALIWCWTIVQTKALHVQAELRHTVVRPVCFLVCFVVCLFVCLSVCLSVCLFVCLFVCFLRSPTWTCWRCCCCCCGGGGGGGGEMACAPRIIQLSDSLELSIEWLSFQNDS